MGLEIVQSHFKSSDFSAFDRALAQETALLKQWFDQGRFSDTGYSLGYELEFWQLHPDHTPCPRNTWLLKELDHPAFVPELSRCNLEFNGPVHDLEQLAFHTILDPLEQAWSLARQAAQKMNSDVAMIGTLPTLTREFIEPHNMTPSHRYQVLNQQIMNQRQGRPFQIEINGSKPLTHRQSDVMAASAATSLQIHLKVPLSRAAQAMNWAQILSPAMVALSANAPLLFGHQLWHETRIPLFEQSVDPAHGTDQKRRTGFRPRFIHQSLFEVFVENLHEYPLLIPLLHASPTAQLKHLKLHNGTIWNWNRAIIGEEPDGTPHLRIEHRAPSAGPTPKDVIANSLFFAGTLHGLLADGGLSSQEFNLAEVQDSFYQAAEHGLQAQMPWCGRTLSLREVILEHLLPYTRKGLTESTYQQAIEGIIQPRVDHQRTGSRWQQDLYLHHKTSPHELLQEYLHHEKQGLPVHLWPHCD